MVELPGHERRKPVIMVKNRKQVHDRRVARQQQKPAPAKAGAR